MAGVSETQAVTLEQLMKKMAEFSKDRDWDQFHTPRNLLLALDDSSNKRGKGNSEKYTQFKDDSSNKRGSSSDSV